MIEKKCRRRIRRKETNDSEVYTGCVQNWISPNLIQKDKDLYVREIVNGPFSSPQLLMTQPIVEISSCRGQAINTHKNYNNLRHGIPDAWKEYLVKKGFCNSMEAFVLQKNLIPFCIRSFATDKIWNELGLPLLQGIPDPWKSKFFPERRSVKCLRQRCEYNDSTSTQITCIYDGDDEAEIEHDLKSQFNEDHVDNKKDPFQEKNKVKKTLQSCTNYLDRTKNNAQKHTDQLQIDKNSQLESKSKTPIKKFRNVQKETEKPISNAGAINIRKNEKSLTTRDKMIQTKEKFDNDKPPLQKYQTNTDNTKNKIENCVNPNYQKYSNVVCHTCTLQNHVSTTVKDFSEQAELQGTDVSNLVLCQNCESLYHNRNLQQLNNTTKTMNVCVLNTTSTLQRKIVDKKKINKSYPYSEKEKRREEKNHIAYDQELKLICGRCNNSHLKITTFKNTIDQRMCSCIRKKKERRKIRTRVSKCSMTRKQSKNVIHYPENYCCTCTETKTHVSREVLDQTRRRNSYDNNATEKNISRVKFDENVKGGIETPIRNFRDNIKDEDVIEIPKEKIIPRTVTKKKLYEKEKLKGDSFNSETRKRRRERRNKSDTMTVAKPRVKQFQQVSFVSTLKYAVSDSGECADVSDNHIDIDGGANVVAEDTLSVTSFTFMQRLKSTTSIRKIYWRMKISKSRRTPQKNSTDVRDFKNQKQ